MTEATATNKNKKATPFVSEHAAASGTLLLPLGVSDVRTLKDLCSKSLHRWTPFLYKQGSNEC